MSNAVSHRILVVDDNTAIHADLRKILCRPIDTFEESVAAIFGETVTAPPPLVYEIDSAYQGADGVAKVRQALDEGRPYAMAFIDVRMPPGIDGIETIEQIWQFAPELQVVVCTAYSDYTWESMFARLRSPDRFLILKKPFSPDEASQFAAALCEKWTLARRAQAQIAENEQIVEERTRALHDTEALLEAEITHRQQAEAHLLRAQRLESIGTLASGIAHDLNNMLSPILMASQLLRMELPAKHEELLSLIETSADRAAAVVKQVLTFARGIEGVRLPLRPKQLIGELGKIINETFPRLIRLETNAPGHLGLINGDATQLHQVLLNLCVNARDAMPDGGTLRIDAEDVTVDENSASMIPGMRAGQYVRLRVADTGAGIPRPLLAKIFDPFYTTKDVGKGTGLGLSTAVGIVRSHDGFIDVQSELGKGTTFEVYLPADLNGVIPLPSPVASENPSGHGELILIVDDERAIRQVIEAVLTQHGYRTLTAADGAEAITAFASRMGEIDAVFTDVMMPVVDGVALCRTLKRIDPKVCILAATGSGDESRMIELRSLKLAALLSKPFSTTLLLSTLATALAQRMVDEAIPELAA